MKINASPMMVKHFSCYCNKISACLRRTRKVISGDFRDLFQKQKTCLVTSRHNDDDICCDAHRSGAVPKEINK